MRWPEGTTNELLHQLHVEMLTQAFSTRVGFSGFSSFLARDELRIKNFCAWSGLTLGYIRYTGSAIVQIFCVLFALMQVYKATYINIFTPHEVVKFKSNQLNSFF